MEKENKSVFLNLGMMMMKMIMVSYGAKYQSGRGER